MTTLDELAARVADVAQRIEAAAVDLRALAEAIAPRPAPAPTAFDEWLRQTDGQRLAYTPGYDGECVQLVRRYVRDVLGLPNPPGVPGAADWWDTGLGPGWQRVVNAPDAVPRAGDVVIWSRRFGPSGHTAVALDGSDARTLLTWGQNLPAGSGAHRQKTNYQHVLGWWRRADPEG